MEPLIIEGIFAVNYVISRNVVFTCKINEGEVFESAEKGREMAWGEYEKALGGTHADKGGWLGMWMKVIRRIPVPMV